MSALTLYRGATGLIVRFLNDPLEVGLEGRELLLGFLTVVNLFNIFLYFVILHEDLKIQCLQIDL